MTDLCTTNTPAPPTAGPQDRYDELRDLVASIAERPVGEPDATLAASAYLRREARLLDLGRYDHWLAGLDDDMVLWVPLHRTSHPGVDQALFLDDRRRLTERVRWRAEPSAWGQHPASVCVRTVATVEAWKQGNAIVASSAITVAEHRTGRSQHLAGHQVHELSGDATRCRTKIVIFPALVTGVRNPSFIL